ncbi:hypothetical protein FRC04_003473 [Tulasnella sp. 424]|nr:hypothetical protein FRC04_003473 [Tulasnella sp. 424]KAG8965737.1 hypothetical protein FRC05_003054 [Tulasnella sp. 425]
MLLNFSLISFLSPQQASLLCILLTILPIIFSLYRRRARTIPFRPTASLPVECWDYIFNNCTLQDVVSFARTSSASLQYSRSYLDRRVREALNPWFPDTLAFRRQLKEHNAIVSGSFVLALVSAPSWTPRDLDVYVGSAGGFDALSLYFENDGFEDVTPPPPLAGLLPQPAYPGAVVVVPHIPPEAQIHTYRRFSKVNDQGTEVFVDLIRTRSTLPGNLVLQFPASCAMNWLTANEIVMTYPTLTLSNVALLHPHCRKPPTGALKMREDIWLGKYTARGFSLAQNSGHVLPYTCGESCPLLERNTRDASCLRITYGDEQWTGDRQQDPTLSWPPPWYRPAKPVCLHPRCPRREFVLSRILPRAFAAWFSK